MTRSSGRFPFLLLHLQRAGWRQPAFNAHYAQSSISHTVDNLHPPVDPADPGTGASQSGIRDTYRQDHFGAASLVQCEQVRRLDAARFERDIPGNDTRFPVRRKRFHHLVVPSRGIRHPLADKPPPYPEIYQPIVNTRIRHYSGCQPSAGLKQRSYHGNMGKSQGRTC